MLGTAYCWSILSLFYGLNTNQLIKGRGIPRSTAPQYFLYANVITINLQTKFNELLLDQCMLHSLISLYSHM